GHSSSLFHRCRELSRVLAQVRWPDFARDKGTMAADVALAAFDPRFHFYPLSTLRRTVAIYRHLGSPQYYYRSNHQHPAFFLSGELGIWFQRLPEIGVHRRYPAADCLHGLNPFSTQTLSGSDYDRSTKAPVDLWGRRYRRNHCSRYKK